MDVMLTLILAIPAAIMLVVGGDQLAKVTGPWGRPGRLLRSVWVPLLIVIPAFGVVRVGADPWTGAAIAVGPVVAAVVVGLIMIAGLRGGTSPWASDDRMPLCWPAAGVMLLVLAVAGQAPEIVGLAIFAIGAVLAWMESIPRSGEHYGGPGVGWLLLAVAGASGLAILCGVAEHPGPVLAVILGAGGLLCIRVAMRCGPREALVSAGWAATLGALLGTGVSSQISAATFVAGVGPPPMRLPQVDQLDRLVVPALLVLCTCGLLAGCQRWSVSWRMLGAIILVTAGAVGGVWVLSGGGTWG